MSASVVDSPPQLITCWRTLINDKNKLNIDNWTLIYSFVDSRCVLRVVKFRSVVVDVCYGNRDVQCISVGPVSDAVKWTTILNDQTFFILYAIWNVYFSVIVYPSENKLSTDMQAFALYIVSMHIKSHWHDTPLLNDIL